MWLVFTLALLPRVAVIGGGLSGLTVGYVLQKSGRYNVTLWEAESKVGGNIQQLPYHDEILNIGHATHLGMFGNLRCLLRHVGVPEVAVGRGSSNLPGLFRMLSVSTLDGAIVQPTLGQVVNVRVMVDAFWFYYHSYLEPATKLSEFLAKRNFGPDFLDILYWSMATFEFDKHVNEAGNYAVGAARALLITQVFFKFLLCDAFHGQLPPKMNRGLMNDLRQRIMETGASADTLHHFDALFNDTSLASYFTADYQLAMERMSDGIGTVHTKALITKIWRNGGDIVVTAESGISNKFDYVVLTIQPSQIIEILDHGDFSYHVKAMRQIKSGAVGVRIIHADNLPFAYPPLTHRPYDWAEPSPTLGIFDISQLSLRNGLHLNQRRKQAGWLSVAYPVYNTTSWNRHVDYLSNIPSLNEKVYPWVKTTASFPAVRRRIVELQGRDNLFVTGHALTGVNKASELQMTNALNLCNQSFGALPPWKHYFSVPLLPDCNDEDAFRRVSGPLEAVQKSIKSMLGSFVLDLVVRAFGTRIFE